MGESDLKCNYLVGGSEGEALLKGHKDELELATEGRLTIAPNPFDNEYCYYFDGEKFIAPVSAEKPYMTMNGQYHQSSFLIFNQGVPHDPFIPMQTKMTEVTKLGMDRPDLLEYQVYATKNADRCPHVETNQTNYVDALISHLTGFATLISFLSFYDNEVSGMDTYRFQVLGYNLPDPPRTGESLPKETEFCPQYSLHRADVEDEIGVEGWTIIRDGKVLKAIPMFGMDSEEGYIKDLEERFKNSEFMAVGPELIRYLRGIKFTGKGDTTMDCPMFEIDVADIPLSEETCLEWSYGKPKDVMQKELGKKLEEQAGYYLIKRGENRYRVISNSGPLDETSLETELAAKFDEGDGAAIELKITDKSPDKRCPVYDVEVIRHEMIREGVKTEKENTFGDVAENTGGKVEVVKGSATKGILSAIKLDKPVKHYQIEILVDTTGSMGNNTRDIITNVDKIINFAKKQVMNGGTVDIGIRSYSGLSMFMLQQNDHDKVGVEEARHKQWFPLSPLGTVDKVLEEAMKAVLDEQVVHFGDTEPVWDAIAMAIKGEDWDTSKGTKQKIIILTDESGDVTDNGYTKESATALAKEKGIEVDIVMVDKVFTRLDFKAVGNLLKKYPDLEDEITGILISEFPDRKEEIEKFIKENKKPTSLFERLQITD